LSAVDILLSFPLLAARDRKLFSTTTYPKLTAYTKKIETQEGYLRSIKKAEELTGEKYSVV
jgi:glutathione S-transferase